MVSGGQDLPPIGCRVVMNATSTLTLLGRRPCQYRAGANAQPAWTSHLTSSSADATSADCCVRMRTSLLRRFGLFATTNETTGTGTGKKTPGEPGHTRPVQYPYRHRRRRLQVPRLTSYTIFDPVVVNWSWCVRRSVYKYCDSSGHLRVRDDISVANPKSLRSSQRRIRTMHTGTIGCNDTG